MGLKMILRKSFLWAGLALLSFSCNTTHNKKSSIEIEFTQDTLNLGYTYWWEDSGPFMSNCGDELSLVFSGTVLDLGELYRDPGPLYVSQKGVVEINQVFKIKNLGENSYTNQKYMITDCFFESGLYVGDKILVICYDYEDHYTIPGKKSLIKITSFEDDALISSIRKYIDADENPLAIKKDIGLWSKQGLGRALQGVIACREAQKESDAPQDH